MNNQRRPGLPVFSAPQLIFAYALAFAIFDLVPIALSDAHVFQGLTWGDLVDAPLILLLAALLLRLAQDADLLSSTALRAGVLVALLLLIQGHAIHLAANAIAHSLTEADAAWEPAYFLDEHWGHYELHIALLSLALLFICFARASQASGAAGTPLLAVSIAGYGALQAAGAIEGQTVPLVLPAALALALAGAVVTSRRPNDYTTFFAASYALCALLLVIYGALNKGWPEIL